MAKAKEITGIDCAADALEWAGRVLSVRFEEVAGLRAAALDFSDIEGVHAMRVSIRRLRSAMRDFMPLMNKRPLKRAIKDLKRTADALGVVRDQDVAIAALSQLQGEAETDAVREGIGNLLREREALRDAARLDLTEALAVGRFNDLSERFTEAIAKATTGGGKKSNGRAAVSFNEAGHKVVARGWQDLYDLGASLYHPFNIEELHEMRIAAKRLRYAIELFAACWGEKIAPFAEEVAEMQSFLGEVHDCDLWIENMSRRLQKDLRGAGSKKGGGMSENDYTTATWLLSEFIRKRTKEYRSALRLWSEWKINGFAERMRAMIQS
ncbi:MAG TPA: CHAD domain-containing protein [Pyrinomonadaceae bacterium]|nr:CHAD domain-containing protein [Pyrinomonadaceae bacterium]